MTIRNRNKFRISRFILLKVPYLFRFLAQLRKPAKRLLIIKTDAIGDYILFRNFIESVYSSDKFTGYEIDLIGNELWRDITLAYDKKYLARTFFVNPDELYNNPFLALKTGWKLYRRNYEQVFQPTYSRTLLNDGIASLAAGKQTIGFLSDTERIAAKYKRRSDQFYSVKIVLPKEITFEFYRTKLFFEAILEAPTTISKPTLRCDKENTRDIIIFPGAGSIKREWKIEYFLNLSKLILKETNYNLIFAGAASELPHGDYLMDKLANNRTKNMIGQTTLPQLIGLIANATCVISSDTSAIHISAACNTPAICIHGVAHFKRFIPYPAAISKGLKFIYQQMPCLNCNWNCCYPTEKSESYPCIEINTVEQVWEAFTTLVINSKGSSLSV